ncbi:MAG: YgeY family selenium metabolism-linked hydrolase [Chloroflexota bacterium]|nr:YgeY family selenium metabolism-linked hydrolase [Chloroflexota bacterium]
MGEFRLSLEDRAGIVPFLRDIVQTPSPSTQEGAVAERIVAEMERLGFDDVHVDRIGNVVGWVGPGHGPLLMFNAHMDTVRVSDAKAWRYAPFGADIENGVLYGLGSCDMKGGLAAMVYGAKLLRDAGVNLKGDVVVACVVQEEPSEGMGSRVLIEEEGIRPDWVVLGEPTGLDVSRGHRGRLEMRLVTYGRSAHAANPWLGENAIYTTARLVFGLELLAEQLGNDDFLGSGTLAVTDITSSASSRNAVPDRCELIIDRRLTLGENETMALSEVQRVIAREGVRAEVEVMEYDIVSYTGYACHVREFYPAWVMAENHPLVVSTVRAVREQLKRRPRVSKWDFSTEGAYTAGVAGIPTVGFGPGDPRYAHTAEEHVRLTDVYAAAEVYARLAAQLLGTE